MTPSASTPFLRAIASRPRIFVILSDHEAHALSRSCARTLCDRGARGGRAADAIASTTDGSVRAIRRENLGLVTYRICGRCQAHPAFSIPPARGAASIREFLAALEDPGVLDSRLLSASSEGGATLKLPLAPLDQSESSILNACVIHPIRLGGAS